MAVLKVTISTSRPSSFYSSNFETATGARAVAQRLVNHVTSVQTGTEGAFSSTVPPTIAFAIQENQVRASGTVTFSGVGAANDTILINGVTFTAQASGATGNQWNVGGTATLSAANLAAAINASVTSLVSGYVSASSVAGVLTIRSVFYGLAGNMNTIAKGVDSTSAMTVSGARFTGGSEDATARAITF